MGILFFFFFLGHWQAVIALPLAGTERDPAPLMADKSPLVLTGFSEEGNKCFSSALVERGLSYVAMLPGGTGAATLCYHVNPCSHGTEDLCRPCGSKRSTWGHHSHSSLFGEFHFLQHSKPRWAKMKDSSKLFNLKPPLHLGPLCSISVQRFGAAVTGPGLWAERHAKTEMSLQSRVRQQQASGWDFRSSNCSLSPPICLCAGDTSPRKANAMSPGYGETPARNTGGLE